MDEKTYTKYSNIRINFTLWMSSEDGDSIIDDQKWQLLIAIQKAWLFDGCFGSDGNQLSESVG